MTWFKPEDGSCLFDEGMFFPLFSFFSEYNFLTLNIMFSLKLAHMLFTILDVCIVRCSLCQIKVGHRIAITRLCNNLRLFHDCKIIIFRRQIEIIFSFLLKT